MCETLRLRERSRRNKTQVNSSRIDPQSIRIRRSPEGLRVTATITAFVDENESALIRLMAAEAAFRDMTITREEARRDLLVAVFGPPSY